MESIGMNLILLSVFCFVLMPFASSLLLSEDDEIEEFGGFLLMMLTFLAIILFVIGLTLRAIGY